MQKRWQVTGAARLVVLGAGVALAAGVAGADVKVYDATPPGGTPGDRVAVSGVLCPTTQVSAGDLEGRSRVDDDGSGTVTLEELIVSQPFTGNFDTTMAYGPGSFVFINAQVSSFPTPGQTGAGSTAKGTGMITWGVISGWSGTGFLFCAASPPTTCTANGYIHGTTIQEDGPVSTTFAIGTWTFDAAGDYEASPYIQSNQNGGLSNVQWQLKGRFVGASLPALPLVGLGVVAAGLVTYGAASIRRRR